MVTEKEWWVEQDQNIKQSIFESRSCIKYFHSMILEIPCNMEISCILFFSKAYFCLLNAVFVCFLIHTFVLQLSISWHFICILCSSALKNWRLLTWTTILSSKNLWWYFLSTQKMQMGYKGIYRTPSNCWDGAFFLN